MARRKPNDPPRPKLSVTQIEQLRAQPEVLRSSEAAVYLDGQIRQAEKRLMELTGIFGEVAQDDLVRQRELLVESGRWLTRRRTLIEVWEFLTNKVRQQSVFES